MAHTIYTYGYTGRKPEELKRYVRELGALLVDVRYSPASRVPQWTRNGLIMLVGRDNYRHERGLGNVNYKLGGPIELADPEPSVEALAGILMFAPVILLCACARLDTCHRAMVADLLARRTGSEIVHLPVREEAAVALGFWAG